MAMRSKRPKNPDVLLRAVTKIFGAECLVCGISRPRPEMAHIRDWRATYRATERKFLRVPSRLTHFTERDRHSQFHHLGNVVPLCPNHHTLFDGDYPDVDKQRILTLRDAALRRPDVLARVIDFIRAELKGRPNRCPHTEENGRRTHTRATDLKALRVPLVWVQNGFRLGLELGDPQLVVDCASGIRHYHVALDQARVDTCFGDRRECAEAPM